MKIRDAIRLYENEGLIVQPVVLDPDSQEWIEYDEDDFSEDFMGIANPEDIHYNIYIEGMVDEDGNIVPELQNARPLTDIQIVQKAAVETNPWWSRHSSQFPVSRNARGEVEADTRLALTMASSGLFQEKVFDNKKEADDLRDQLNEEQLERSRGGYEFGEVEAADEFVGEPGVTWVTKPQVGGTYIVAPLEEEDTTRVPELAATQENIPAAQQQAAMLTNATGVPHEFHEEDGQWEFRPIEAEAEAEGYSYEEALRDAPPGFQPKPTNDPNQWIFERVPVRDIDEQIAQLLSEGRFDEAAKLDQIRDQLNEERLTPERAAEMLVGISYSPSDFKDMMDAILGNDTQMDTRVDIGELQEQASAMLRGEVPAAQTVSQMPAFEPPPVFPVPTPFDDRAVDLDKMYVEQAGNIPYIENMLFQQGEQDALMEEGLAPEVVSAPPEQAEPIFTPPEPNQVLSRDIAAIGANAAASAEQAAIQRATQDSEIRRIQNTPFTSTAEKLKAMEEVMGPRAALYMRNQRLLQPQQQQLFEARRPTTRRYV